MKVEIITKHQIKSLVADEVEKQMGAIYKQIEVMRRRLFRIEEDLRIRI
jgi:predicted kinase